MFKECLKILLLPNIDSTKRGFTFKLEQNGNNNHVKSIALYVSIQQIQELSQWLCVSQLYQGMRIMFMAKY